MRRNPMMGAVTPLCIWVIPSDFTLPKVWTKRDWRSSRESWEGGGEAKWDGREIKNATCPNNWVSEGRSEIWQWFDNLIQWLFFFFSSWRLAAGVRITVLSTHLCSNTTVWLSDYWKRCPASVAGDSCAEILRAGCMYKRSACTQNQLVAQDFLNQLHYLVIFSVFLFKARVQCPFKLMHSLQPLPLGKGFHRS